MPCLHWAGAWREGRRVLEKYQSLCEERQKIIVSHDRASKNPAKHVAENPARHLVCQYCLDDKTILGDNASCCDYLVLNCEQKLAYFIELKGRHIREAKRQFACAETLVAEDIEGFARFYRIIYRSNTHDVQSNEMVAWKKKAGSYRGIPVVVVKSMLLKERITF